MKKILLMIIASLIIFYTPLSFADNNQFLLNIRISNQSFEKPNERIILYLDGKLLFEDVLPVYDQHHEKSFNIQVNSTKRHWIRVVAKDSNIESGLTLDIERDKYVSIGFWVDKIESISGFQFNINDEYIGME